MVVDAKKVAASVLPASQANDEIIAVAQTLADAAKRTEDVAAAQQMLDAVKGLLQASGHLTGALEDVGKALKAE